MKEANACWKVENESEFNARAVCACAFVRFDFFRFDFVRFVFARFGQARMAFREGTQYRVDIAHVLYSTCLH